MKKTVNAFDYAGEIMKAMPKGILLTTKHNGQVNTMTIGWGMLGIEWGKPVFIALVRTSRYTHQLLEQTGEFTVNVPIGEVDGKILGFCGTRSGRDTDKIQQMQLTLEEPVSIDVPGIRQFPLTLECKVIYKQAQDLSKLGEDILNRYYPQNVDSSAPGNNSDYHIAYYGQILNAYLIEDEI